MNQTKPTAVLARRWFDGVNTYHTVCVVYDDMSEKVSPMTYGYGDQYMHTAGTLMADLYDNPCKFTSREARAQRIYVDVVDVARKRDLHNRGRGDA